MTLVALLNALALILVVVAAALVFAGACWLYERSRWPRERGVVVPRTSSGDAGRHVSRRGKRSKRAGAAPARTSPARGSIR